MMTTDTPMRGRAAARAGSVPLPPVAFALVAALVALPILAHPYLPLVDLPNHIARLHVAAHADGPLSEFYSYTIRVVPNSAADLLWKALGFPGDAARFAQWTFAFYGVALVAATMALARQIHGRWTAWSAASGLVVYNACFYWGFQNYLISLPFALLGFALHLASEGWPMRRRLLLFIPYGFGLFMMHFFAFVALAVLAFGREIQCVAVARSGTRLGTFLRRLPIALPYILPTGWLVAGMLTGPAGAQGARTSFGALGARLTSLKSPAIMEPVWLGLPTALAGMAVLLFLAVAGGLLFRRRGARLAIAPAAVGPAVAVLTVGLLAPYWLNGVALTHIRLPVVGVLVLFAGTEWRGLSRRGLVAVGLCVTVLLGLRAASFEAAARRYSADVADLVAVTEPLPPKALILPLRAKGRVFDMVNWHSDAYAVVYRDAFSPLLFQGVHQLSIRPGYLDRTHPMLYPLDLGLAREVLGGANGPVFMQDWPRKYTHVLLMDPPAAADLPDLEALAVLEETGAQGRFTLFRIGGS